MAIIFALRGDSLTPRYAKGGRDKSPFLAAANFSTPPAVVTAASISATGTRGSSLIDVHLTNGDERAMRYRTGANWVHLTNVFSIRYSFVPNWSGNPASDKTLFYIGNDANNFYGGLKISIYDNGKLNVHLKTGDDIGSSIVNGTTTNALSFTSKTKTEIMIKCDGTTLYASQDGVEVGSWALAITDRYMNNVLAGHMTIGPYPVDTWADELIIWDTAEAHVYTPAAGYETVDSYDATSHTTLTASQVASGVAFGPGPGASTGSLVTGTDPATTDVRSGVSWINGSGVTVTGSLVVPTTYTGTSSLVNFAQIKENLRYFLSQANTTTADFDLSSGLLNDKRVKRIATRHPGKLPMAPTEYPYVSMFVDSKDIDMKDIAGNQKNAKRMHTIRLKIVGGIVNNTIKGVPTLDKADDDCERLMENIEEVLRRNPTLGGVCLWHAPSGVTYHNRAFDEETHLRVGVLSLDIAVMT